MISVIIPTLNEEHNIGGCLDRVLGEECVSEVIVCDGGSGDRTRDIVRAHKDGRLALLKTRRGRGSQMNEGGFAARGEILLFLHADTRLEKGWCGPVAEAVGEESVSAGAFTLRIDSPGRRFRLIESWVGLRCRIFKLPYGDQGLFVRRRLFGEIGGYRDIPLMEDVEILKRLKARGRIAILKENVVTSARRWEREGWLYTSLRNQLIMLLYRIGVDPHALAGMYYR